MASSEHIFLLKKTDSNYDPPKGLFGKSARKLASRDRKCLATSG
ncbi:MAG: hypothetical protein ACI9G1_003878, partial [Pirellulaceae bacterium]